MRRARLLALLALPLALLAAAWFGPRLLDWEAQRDRVAAIAAARLGRPVVLGGPLSVTLLPQPMVEASAVLVGTADANDDAIGVTARALRLRLGLWPLLAGRFEPRELVLVGAEIRLPWPPGNLGALRPPPWLTGFDARVEDSRIALGDAVLDGVAARLAAPGPLDAVRTEGSFTWRGAALRFEAVLGRPGFDGVATFDLLTSGQGAHATLRGVLVAEGGFEGRIEAAGNDLSALIAAPAGPFRASGRVMATAELAAADGLALELGGVPGRGAATFRFAPSPRLDVALALARLDLDAWVAALRGAPAPPVVVGLDLSAEAASFGGQTLRRLRGGVLRQGERLAVSALFARLPGEAELEAAGGVEGGRLELTGRVAGPSLRATLAAAGLGVERFDPARLGGFELRGRITLDAAGLGLHDLAGMLDGARMSGAGTLRPGPRPALGLGLTFDRLDLDGVLPGPAAWRDLFGTAPPMDANLRVAAANARWGGIEATRASLDMVLEAQRLAVRHLGFQAAGAEVTLAGIVTPGVAPRFADLALDLVADQATGLAALFDPLVKLPAAPARLPIRLRVSGGGPAEALALALQAELGEMRLEGRSEIHLPEARAAGALTVRHPGAPRLMTLLGAAEPPAWLGEGSFSLIAAVSGSAAGLAAENMELVAGGLRARGQAALALGGALPRLTGRLLAERLPLPGIPSGDAGPLDFALLSAFEGEVALEAAEALIPGLPVLRPLVARLSLAGGRLALEGLEAGFAGGRLEGRLVLESAAQPPVLAGALGITGATLSEPLLGLPFDIASGQVAAEGRFTARGHAPGALLSTLEGEGRLAVTHGVLSGVALAQAAGAAVLADPAAAEDGVRAALADGATAVDRIAGGWRAAGGIVTLEEVRIAAEGGATGAVEGRIDLLRQSLDLRLLAQPPAAGAPAIALRLSGPAQAPRRQPEIAAWARWLAER